MPALVAAIGPVAGLFGGSGFGALLTNALIGVAINAAVGVAIDWITPDEPANENAITGVELQFRAGAKVALSAILGMKDTPGHLAYHNSYGNDNEYLQLLFIDGNGAHHSMTGLLVDNASTALSGSNANVLGYVIEKFRINGNGAEDPAGQPYGWVKFYTGDIGQAADPELVARSNPIGRWTNQCTMTATAYRVVTLRYHPTLFGGGLPNLRAIWKGLKVYDRRKDSSTAGGAGPHRWGQPSTYEWSENAAICQDNWRRGIWVNGVRLLGLGVSEYDCYYPGIISAANICDEQVTYTDTGAVLPRYSLGVEIKDGTDPISVMRIFEAAMGGYGAEYGGAYTPLPAQTMAPVLTLTDKHRVAGTDTIEQTRMSPLETKTAFHGQFLNPVLGWIPDDYDVRYSAAAEVAEGGRRLEPFDASFTRHRETASMLAEIKVRRDRFSAVEVSTFGPRAADLRPGQVITRQNELLGTIPMMVVGIQRQPKKQFQLSLREWNNSIVPSPTGGFMPLPVDPIVVQPPSRLTHPLDFLVVAAQMEVGATSIPVIRCTWAGITDSTVAAVLIKYWPTANPAAVQYLRVDGPKAGFAAIDQVTPRTTYQVQATVITDPARGTMWTNPQTVTVGTVQWDIADLNNNFKRLIGVLPGDGSLIERFEELQQQLDDLAESILKTGTVGRVERRTLEATQNENRAYFVEQVAVVVDTTQAAVDLTTLLLAEFDGNNAVAAERVGVVANEFYSQATYAQEVAAEAGGVTASAFRTAVVRASSVSGYTIEVADILRGSVDGKAVEMGRLMLLNSATGQRAIVDKASEYRLISDDGGTLINPWSVVAGVIYLTDVRITGSLIVAETITTNLVLANAMTTSAAFYQGSEIGPNQTLVSGNISVAYGSVKILFTGYQWRPQENGSNFGGYSLRVLRNGSVINTLSLYYDDNFAGVVSIAAVDTPGPGVHTYSIDSVVGWGPGQFAFIPGGAMFLDNFKR
ncbi:hypothetical protein ASG47_19755 [Devosia sp. Leaf420]|uniref:hypothetical protein n=1 Tax=Devosia sp. Leaf420 TaxID=1736374 RepID=UPI0007132CA3|nr:hypothetical protein [Devosia sp. Leaf420]KQT50341.1 hypothetical protein ASG47_19755 [Devosia sp. Leaf420]